MCGDANDSWFEEGVDSASLILLLSSGASRQYLDSDVALAIRLRITDYAELKLPHRIVPAGIHVVEDVATGTASGTVIDRDGKKHPIRLSIIICLRRHLFSAAAASSMEAAIVTYSVESRLEMRGVTLALERRGDDGVLYTRTFRWTRAANQWKWS